MAAGLAKWTALPDSNGESQPNQRSIDLTFRRFTRMINNLTSVGDGETKASTQP
jgi:hypothetical protein